MNNVVGCFCFLLCVLCQIPAKAGDIVDDAFLKKHLRIQNYDIDTSASAVILFEKEEFQIGFSDTGMYRKSTITRVIRILKDDAFYLGTLAIVSFSGKDMNITGATYNLVNGSTERSYVEKIDISETDLQNGMQLNKVYLPKIKKGCIIAYSYEQQSAKLPRLFSWQIQGSYPKLRSEYSVTSPVFTVGFDPVRQSHLTPVKYESIWKAEKGDDDFAIAVLNIGGDNMKSFYIRRNVPAFKEEPYILNSESYRERQDLYLVSSYIWGPNTWENFNENIWKKQGLEAEVYGPNLFFLLTLDSLVKDQVTDSEKAIAIYKYVRNNFTVTIPSSEVNVVTKEVWENKAGSAPAINTLLLSMLAKAKLQASPLFLATTDNARLSEVAPVKEHINYIACVVKLNSSYLLLDASDKNNVAGMLPLACYNGFAWAGDGYGIGLESVQLENSDKFYTRIYDITEGEAKIKIRYKMGMIASLKLRKKCDQRNNINEECIKQLKQKLPKEVELTTQSVENAGDPDANIVVNVSGTLRLTATTDVFYLQDNIAGVFTTNPFSSPNRTLPIEFPFRSNYINSTSIEFPANYVPEKIFTPLHINYDSTLNYTTDINYLPNSNIMTINSSFTMGRTRFEASEYKRMSTFFAQIVSDNGRQLVFKKKD